MKLHISVSQPDLAGFVNLDVAKISVNLGSLDDFCEASECTQIIVNDVLKFMSYDKIPFVLQHLASKLRHRGKLTLIFTDINSLVREFNRGALDEKTFNELAYQNGANSCCSLDYMQRCIAAIRLKPTEISVSREQVIFTAERP